MATVAIAHWVILVSTVKLTLMIVHPPAASMVAHVWTKMPDTLVSAYLDLLGLTVRQMLMIVHQSRVSMEAHVVMT
jgi:hypothetical protein